MQILAIKTYKAKKKKSPELVCDIFQFTEKIYGIRNKSTSRTKTEKTAYFGSGNI